LGQFGGVQTIPGVRFLDAFPQKILGEQLALHGLLPVSHRSISLVQSEVLDLLEKEGAGCIPDVLNAVASVETEPPERSIP
jgi:hypothetical protein